MWWEKRFNHHHTFEQRVNDSGHQWLTPIILATWEVEIRRVTQF
jgi:hypothetical protein